MKTFKITFVALTLFLLIGNVKADKPKIHAYSNLKLSISTFIDADTRGICDGLTEIIDDNARFNAMHAGHVLSFNKKQMVNYMQSLEGVEQNCTTSYDVIEAHGNYVLVKVEMKYPTFSRFNYVTITECKGGWKIINVNSIFTK